MCAPFRLPLATACQHFIIGQALRLSRGKASFLNQDALTLVALVSPAPFEDEGRQGGMFTRPLG